MAAYAFNGQVGDDAKVMFGRLVTEFPPMAAIRDAAIALQAERVKYDADRDTDAQAMIDAGRALLDALLPLTESEPEVLPN